MVFSMVLGLVAAGFLALASVQMWGIVMRRVSGMPVDAKHYVRFTDYLMPGVVLAIISGVVAQG